MDLNRRQLLQGAASATTAGLIAGGATLAGRPALARPAQALRPPGALAEADFLGACVRCGLCVRDCPPQNLKLSRWGDGLAADVSIGTPYFVAREIPCEMCEDLPCVKACPTGALDPALTDITQARMGVAVLIDQENCLNFLGLRCDVCYRVCPVIDQAITLEKVSNPRSDRHAMLLPTVHAEACTGCGMCEKSCVLEQAAIKVLPAAIARGELGHHYRKGWDAGNQAGRPRFEQPTQTLPEHAVPGDLVPLRSGAEPYAGPSPSVPAASGVGR
ncbi:periplasmic nitrate reductase subunit NapG [Sphaerotilus hippei]|uniref:Periplasmic nitrate reductase subunit NapG n=1 Tax=Sphaerotilus hippei TaxID=744406 RepID=A0A318GVI7_9BURK|nr:ferredoxin-type protein NapG [Sphaerotilus hippei]PXW93387.1 periplasmic nitrate reductase subunit NapG [Sphaerotilus hippei]